MRSSRQNFQRRQAKQREWAEISTRTPSALVTDPLPAAEKLAVVAATRSVRGGGIIAYPTEGVFGLGCLPGDDRCIDRILAIKRRNPNKGLIVIGARAEHLLPYAGRCCFELLARLETPSARTTTWVVRAAAGLSRHLTGGRHTIGLRLTRHPVAAALCEQLGQAVVSTSANRAGASALLTSRDVRLRLGRELDYILSGQCGADQRPSRIVELSTGRTLRA